MRSDSVNFNFNTPYSIDNGGVAIEPWHLSYTPVAEKFENALSISYVDKIIDSDKLLLSDVVASNLEEIFLRFILNKK